MTRKRLASLPVMRNCLQNLIFLEKPQKESQNTWLRPIPGIFFPGFSFMRYLEIFPIRFPDFLPLRARVELTHRWVFFYLNVLSKSQLNFPGKSLLRKRDWRRKCGPVLYTVQYCTTAWNVNLAENRLFPGEYGWVEEGGHAAVPCPGEEPAVLLEEKKRHSTTLPIFSCIKYRIKTWNFY